jgi:adenylate cyclase
MNDTQLTAIAAGLTEAGLAGHSGTAALTGFCQRALAQSLPLARANVVIDTLHPVYEGRAFTWKLNQEQAAVSEYGRGMERSALRRVARAQDLFTVETPGESHLAIR